MRETVIRHPVLAEVTSIDQDINRIKVIPKYTMAEDMAKDVLPDGESYTSPVVSPAHGLSKCAPGSPSIDPTVKITPPFPIKAERNTLHPLPKARHSALRMHHQSQKLGQQV